MRAKRSGPLLGALRPPGDKSISHRALILASLAEGATRITDLLDGADVMATANALRALGADVGRQGDGAWVVRGVGDAGYRTPDGPLDLGNAGTGCRLVMGAMAGSAVRATFTGDASLSSRPMGRVLEPLAAMGADVSSHDGRLPAVITGRRPLRAISWDNPKGSAQVKSAVLLAGLQAQGDTVVTEPFLSRNHTEIMLADFGAEVVSAPSNGGWRHAITGPCGLVAPAHDVRVPGDPSSAAFAAAAALITPGSHVTIEGVMANPLRTEGLRALAPDARPDPAGGGETWSVAYDDQRQGRIFRQVDMANAMDEAPILAVAAAFATGVTRFEGFDELRVKESDRIAATCAMLGVNGVTTEAWDDGFAVHGAGPDGVAGGGLVATRHDHRIAMSALVLGLAAREPVTIDDASMIATSYPTFFDDFSALGARFEMLDTRPLGTQL